MATITRREFRTMTRAAYRAAGGRETTVARLWHMRWDATVGRLDERRAYRESCRAWGL